ncbi:hypothetical protein B0H12DRAFT_661930 [Mycena haematopus]|nr:hypothetical protein B0H12DRAFT_661930 [Mycena haematopus]
MDDAIHAFRSSPVGHPPQRRRHPSCTRTALVASLAANASLPSVDAPGTPRTGTHLVFGGDGTFRAAPRSKLSAPRATPPRSSRAVRSARRLRARSYEMSAAPSLTFLLSLTFFGFCGKRVLRSPSRVERAGITLILMLSPPFPLLLSPFLPPPNRPPLLIISLPCCSSFAFLAFSLRSFVWKEREWSGSQAASSLRVARMRERCCAPLL